MSFLKSFKKEEKNIIINVFFALLNLFFVIIFFKNILLTSIILCVLAILFVSYHYHSSPILIVVFVFGMFGAVAEMFAITYGVWAYSLYNIYNVPLWLFVLWGNAALFIYRMAIEFERLGFHK
jgi:uncharacterized membrane protein YoaT (DUF817 family)